MVRRGRMAPTCNKTTMVKGAVGCLFPAFGEGKTSSEGVSKKKVSLVQWWFSILRLQPPLAERVCGMEKTKLARIWVWEDWQKDKETPHYPSSCLSTWIIEPVSLEFGGNFTWAHSDTLNFSYLILKWRLEKFHESYLTMSLRSKYAYLESTVCSSVIL